MTYYTINRNQALPPQTLTLEPDNTETGYHWSILGSYHLEHEGVALCGFLHRDLSIMPTMIADISLRDDGTLRVAYDLNDCDGDEVVARYFPSYDYQAGKVIATKGTNLVEVFPRRAPLKFITSDGYTFNYISGEWTDGDMSTEQLSSILGEGGSLYRDEFEIAELKIDSETDELIIAALTSQMLPVMFVQEYLSESFHWEPTHAETSHDGWRVTMWFAPPVEFEFTAKDGGES